MRARLPAALAAALLLIGAAADDPADRLPNPAQEARARHLFEQLRCVVCQNESLDESEATLAGDLRRIVRQQIAAGRSDDQVRAFLVRRYGQFILLKPPLSPGNAALWLAPLAALALGGAYIAARARRPPAVDDPLSPEEARALATLTGAPEPAAPPAVPPQHKSALAVESDGAQSTSLLR